MRASGNSGRLWVRYGPMGAEKTTWLIKQYLPNKSLIFIPELDHRSGKSLKAHNGNKLDHRVTVVNQNKPQMIREVWQREKDSDRVLIDESNFFSEQLVEVIKWLVLRNVKVMVAGLLLDTDLNDFGPTRKIAKMANEAKSLHAKCDYVGLKGAKCKNPARFNYFKGQKPGQVVVGAFDIYGAACVKHYDFFREKYQVGKINNKVDYKRVWRV